MTTSMFCYGVVGVLTIGVTAIGLGPKFASFNQSSQGHQNALAAAETCLLLEQVKAGIRPIYGPTGGGIPPGTYLCDAMGNTAQTQPDGLLGPVSTGQPEVIRQRLADRSLLTPTPQPSLKP